MSRPPALAALALVAAAPAPPLPPPLIEQVDLKATARPRPGPGEAMIVLRAFANAMAGENRILFHRLDAAGKPILNAEDKPIGAKLTYGYSLFGGEKGVRTLRVAIVPAGDYVLAGRTFNLNYTDSFCFGAPRFTLAPGSVVYVGDFEMVALAKMADGERRNAMPYSFQPEETRAMLAAVYPAEAALLVPWRPANGTRAPCRGDEFTAYAVPSPPAEPSQETRSAAR